VACAKQPLAFAIATASALPNGSVDLAYSETLIADGGTPPYSWSIASGNLPAGLSLSSAGLISGTPSAAGSYAFSVAVADAAATPVTKTKALTLAIAHDVALTWTASAASGVTYTVYRGTTSGGPYSAIASGITPTAFTDTSVQSGTTYYYVCTVTSSGGESAHSSEATAVVPYP
jgi:hypothetical protein